MDSSFKAIFVVVAKNKQKLNAAAHTIHTHIFT